MGQTILNKWGTYPPPFTWQTRRPKPKRRLLRWSVAPESRFKGTDAEPSGWQVQDTLKNAVSEGCERLKTDLQGIFDRLSALKKIEDVEDEYTFKPTERAYTEAKLTIEETADLMGKGFPMPRIVPDGEGGIVADWLRNGRRVRLRFRANKERRDYIYHRSGEHYDVERMTTENLIERLGWLLSA
jgi:hypothetical protein